jgi:UDP-2-acetamido-3-amino-2,3-dideoxy-glucuronate N-acetyltransferase
LKPFIHSNGICESESVGEGTRVWAFAHILSQAQIGRDCNICDHVFIENDVVLGDRVTVKSGVQLWDGLRVGNDVFLGPNATFTNDKFPRSKARPETFPKTIIEDGVSVGANATILPGIRLGTRAMIGAGAVVTRDVPPGAIVSGNPARITGYVDTDHRTLRPVNTVAGTIIEPGTQHLILNRAFLTRLPTHRDARGTLSVAEFTEHLPFAPRRVFFVYDVPSHHVRGEHAHRQCEQLLVCIHGSVSVVLDDGRERQEISLNAPDLGLYIPTYLWATQYRCSRDAVMAVFASHPYDPTDYIRDYADFLVAIGKDRLSHE